MIDDQIKKRYKIAIIGAGIGGIVAGIELKKKGIEDFIILEKEGGIGGTWRDNTYPGCTCDVPSHLYSLSSFQKPDWKDKFAKQPDILDYLKQGVKAFNLEEKMRFQTAIVRMTFKEEEGIWELFSDSTWNCSAQFIISATGPLNVPKYPDIPGREKFTGRQFHSLYWDHSFDYSDKKVIVVGTGASAIQIVPQLAQSVRELHVLQRTAPWILPKWDRKMKTFEIRLFTRFPFLLKAYRKTIYWLREFLLYAMINNGRLLDFLERYALRHLHQSVPDTELREKLTPHFRLGCKRILLSNDYYRTLNRENVFLHTEKPQAFEEGHLLFPSGKKIQADAIIFGTGFYPSMAISKIRIKGLENQSLIRNWLKKGPKSYLGMMSSGFPNLFFLLGPNTGLANTSILLMMEAQVDFIINMILRSNSGQWSYVDVKESIQETYVEQLRQKLSKALWSTSGCSSWYLSADGSNWSLWPGFVHQYVRRTKKIQMDHFRFVR